MAQVPFPAPGDDGDEPPLPGAAARDGLPGDAVPERDGVAGPDGVPYGGPSPDGPAGEETAPAAAVGDAADGDDWDAAADLAQMLADIDAGLIAVPPEDEHAPAVTFSVGEAADVDPAELAAMAGPGGLGGHGFGQHDRADGLRPGPLLSALTEQAAADPAGLSDDELLGMVSAARRLAGRAQYLELTGIAEFGRRRAAQYQASVTAKKKPGRRDGEFADDELAMELVLSRRAAGDRMELAGALAARLPRTRAALAAGLIDDARAAVIWSYTRFLSDPDAAYADAVLAEAAPRLKYEQLAGRAYRLEIKLDPVGTRRRREEARRAGRRVEARREASGNMCFGGRELGMEEALAAKAFNDADALALRAAGMDGTLRDLRVLALLDRARGLNPQDRLTRSGGSTGGASEAKPDTADAGHRGPAGHDGHPDQDDSFPDHDDGYRDGGQDGQDDRGRGGDGGREDGYGGEEGPDGGPGDGGPGGPGAPGGGAPVPLSAVINLLVPAGTMLGWSNAPGEAGSWGLLDPAQTRAAVAAASRHPRTRWCVTITGSEGTAVAHGCARGQHPWTPPGRDGPGTARDANPAPGPPAMPGQHEPSGASGPDQYQRAQLAALLRALNVTLAPIASGSCDHRQREDRYTPSRALRHLVQARTARCVAPGCGAHAAGCDLDHTRPWPAGPTDQCNLSPPCRHHHRVKQAPGWKLEQDSPGVMRWTAPSGRVYTTTPTVYDT